jgi:23S rRNA (guanine745-N1)-methyltransferase
MLIMHTFVVQNILCPVCREDLRAHNTGLSCEAGHSFDFARQGYVNLIHNRPSVRIR